MLYGVQTHFGGLIGAETCLDLYARRFRLARIDAQNVSVETMLAMVYEALWNGLMPYVTVSTLEQIEALPLGSMCEWRNEPDLAISGHGVIPPAEYARELKLAAEVAQRSPVEIIGGPVVSNLNKRGVDYINAVNAACDGTMPLNVFGVTHRYGNGTYALPHYLHWYGWLGIGPFQSREAELRWFKRTIGEGRMWGVSEFGYPSVDNISEEQQADRVSKDFDLYRREGAYFAVNYQINDGPGKEPIDHFGLRRVTGEWKPVADVVPHS